MAPGKELKMEIKVIGFDADDTLWVNEPYFQETEKKFCSLLSEYLGSEEITAELLKTEMQNIELYGFGAKSFMLSMIETANRISDRKVSSSIIDEIIKLGKELLDKPVELLDGVEDVLQKLYGKYKLIVATKGDLLDQERKLKKSGIAKYFHHVEIMSDKKEENYKSLLNHLEILPENFLMVGNSFKSDILPVVNLGGYGIYIPYHVTWQHEKIDETISNGNERVKQIKEISELLEYLLK
jgi:putative hydrolase of the HAD superfamily